MKVLRYIVILLLLLVSTTQGEPIDLLLDMGPVPPQHVQEWDMEKSMMLQVYDWDELKILPVPGYIWRHGCVLTSTGMLLGYWDMQPGFEDLIDGDCSYQSFVADQMMASGGVINPYVSPWDVIPWPEGQEQHMEDYSLPIDTGFDLFTDAYITAGRDPHPHNSLGDYMKTSWSTLGISYGGTRVGYIGLGMDDYTQDYTNYDITWGIVPVSEGNLYERSGDDWPDPNLEYYWDLYKAEIDADRPVLLVVDTYGYGSPGHMITGIGYREDYETGRKEYASLDTWPDPNEVRWEEFTFLRQYWPPAYPWGVYSFYTVDIVPREEFIVTFPDPDLEVVIREALSKPIGDITNLEMRVIVTLDATSSSISDLTGIEYCRNLKELYLSSNDISNISSLSHLRRLKILYLGGNDIVDISPLKPLLLLETLILQYNLIEEIPDGVFFNMITTLEYLDLSHNQIDKLSNKTFGRLLLLDNLILSYNQLTEIPEGVFSELYWIEYINLSHNQINYIHSDTFIDLRYVEYLYLNHNLLEDTSFLYPYAESDFMDPPCYRNMMYLEVLRLCDNLITDISGILGEPYSVFPGGPIRRCGATTLILLHLQNNLLNLDSHCKYLPQIIENNPDLAYFDIDENPNPFMQDCSNDMVDLMIFLSGWLRTDCVDIGYWCGGTDFDFSGKVDLKDYTEFTKYWSNQ